MKARAQLEAGMAAADGAAPEFAAWSAAPEPAALVELATDECGLVVTVDGRPVRNVAGVRLRAGVAGHYHVELELGAVRVNLPRLEAIDAAKG